MSKRWLVLIFAVGAFLQACQQNQPNLSEEKIRSLANAYYNRELYPQSIAQYENYLEHYSLSETEQANISYTIANIYFDRLNDYENAMAYYERIKLLYPESDVVDESEKRIVECLERLQRSSDAQQALQEASFLDESQVQKKRPGEVIAMIGDREITTGDLEYEMKSLPPFVLAQIKDQSKKIEFLKQYIATELLYNTAKRKGLERDPEVIEAAYQAKKNFMVQKLLQEELSSNVDFEEEDLHIYFRANQSKYMTEGDSTQTARQLTFDEARQQVTQDLIRSKQQAVYQRLVDRMMRAENVKIFEDKIQ
ncbi:MAG: hypothetical protein H6695_10765 [Deferribacteres bacterium]|nr:hypothetical protein [Deferribacteres bacterium]